MDLNEALKKIMNILKGVEGDIEVILDELRDNAYQQGTDEGYSAGYEKGLQDGKNQTE